LPWVMAGVLPPTWMPLSKTDKRQCGESPQAIHATGDAPDGRRRAPVFLCLHAGFFIVQILFIVLGQGVLNQWY